MKVRATPPDVLRMQPHRPLAGVLALLSVVLGAGAFALVMSRVGGVWPFLAFPASAIAAVGGFVALGAPRTRRDLEPARLARD
jgi:hypothetical protein